MEYQTLTCSALGRMLDVLYELFEIRQSRPGETKRNNLASAAFVA